MPLLVLAAQRYVAQLRDELEKLELEQPYEITHLGSKVVRDVVDKVNAQDLIMVTTMGSQMRFRSSLGHIPEQLAAATSDSIVAIHYP